MRDSSVSAGDQFERVERNLDAVPGQRGLDADAMETRRQRTRWRREFDCPRPLVRVTEHWIPVEVELDWGERYVAASDCWDAIRKVPERESEVPARPVAYDTDDVTRSEGKRVREIERDQDDCRMRPCIGGHNPTDEAKSVDQDLSYPAHD